MKTERIVEAEKIRDELRKLPHFTYRELMLLLADDVHEAKEKEKKLSGLMAMANSSRR